MGTLWEQIPLLFAMFHICPSAGCVKFYRTWSKLSRRLFLCNGTLALPALYLLGWTSRPRHRTSRRSKELRNKSACGNSRWLSSPIEFTVILQFDPGSASLGERKRMAADFCQFFFEDTKSTHMDKPTHTPATPPLKPSVEPQRRLTKEEIYAQAVRNGSPMRPNPFFRGHKKTAG